MGTGSLEWECLPILKQSLIQTPVQFSRDLYVAEMGYPLKAGQLDVGHVR